jgi:uncharacterized protein YecE (DUF72 family)
MAAIPTSQSAVPPRGSEVERSDAVVGTAGWSIPRAVADQVPGEGSHLQRYARRFAGVEINSSFYRPHRPSTYQRWAESVPPNFRFSVKVPKAATHERKLVDCGEILRTFTDGVAALGRARGPALVQLPPSLAFDQALAEAFFGEAARHLGPAIVCEPRHPSWFEPAADRLLAEHRVARVAADPAIAPTAAVPGGWAGLAYFRLHGAPAVYRSPYDETALRRQRDRIVQLRDSGTECWTIFDNTASGAALANALQLAEALERGAEHQAGGERA